MARTHRYDPRVFLAPFRADIFVRDAERPPSAREAERTEAVMRESYLRYGYTLVDLPCAGVAERAAFVVDRLARDPRQPTAGHDT